MSSATIWDFVPDESGDEGVYLACSLGRISSSFALDCSGGDFATCCSGGERSSSVSIVLYFDGLFGREPTLPSLDLSFATISGDFSPKVPVIL